MLYILPSRSRLSWLQPASLLLVLLFSCVSDSLAAQVSFQIANQTQVDLSSHTVIGSPSQPTQDQEDVIQAIRLSHAGLYINQAHSSISNPSSFSSSSSSPSSSPRKPLPLSLYIDPNVYRAETVVVRLGPIHLRSRDDVMLECGRRDGGIESCQDDDLHQAAQDQTFSSRIECRPTESTLSPDGRLILDHRSCPGWLAFWADAEYKRSKTEVLESFVVSATIEPLLSSLSGPEEKRWWIGHLLLDESRASWPLAGNARDHQKPAQPLRQWHPDNVNRISGAMENPIIPKASSIPSGNKHLGVFVDQSRWNLGVQIRIPSTGGNENGNSSWVAPEEVHAPVDGQIVWSRPYVCRMPPLTGPSAGVNDQQDHCIMIRDEWSIVYQIFGVDPNTITVKEGEYITRGHVVGHAVRDALSVLPPSTDPPADHPSKKPDEGTPFYPYRFRKLEIRVTRPHRSWTEWKDPNEPGWQYFHPLHVFREGRDYHSSVPPYGSPTTLFFSRPKVGSDPLESTPTVFASSADYYTPTLSGLVEIFVGFESFQQTPSDPADGMDPLAIYALEYTVRKILPGDRIPDRSLPCDLGGNQTEMDWIPVFEHSKLPNHWTSPSSSITSKLFANYVPAFQYGRFFPDQYISQFDEKERKLYYAATRTSRGELDRFGSWNVTQLVLHSGAGSYRLVLRARDYWGNVGCVSSQVVLR